MIVRMTVFWTVCYQIYIAMRNLNCAVGALWCSGAVLSPRNQRVGGSSPPSAYALRQGILSTIVSLNPSAVNGYR